MVELPPMKVAQGHPVTRLDCRLVQSSNVQFVSKPIGLSEDLDVQSSSQAPASLVTGSSAPSRPLAKLREVGQSWHQAHYIRAFQERIL